MDSEMYTDETYKRIVKIFDNNNFDYFLCGNKYFNWPIGDVEDFDLLVYSEQSEELYSILQYFGFIGLIYKELNMNNEVYYHNVHIQIIQNKKSFEDKKKINQILFKKINPTSHKLIKRLRSINSDFKNGPLLFETLKAIYNIKL